MQKGAYPDLTDDGTEVELTKRSRTAYEWYMHLQRATTPPANTRVDNKVSARTTQTASVSERELRHPLLVAHAHLQDKGSPWFTPRAAIADDVPLPASLHVPIGVPVGIPVGVPVGIAASVPPAWHTYHRLPNDISAFTQRRGSVMLPYGGRPVSVTWAASDYTLDDQGRLVYKGRHVRPQNREALAANQAVVCNLKLYKQARKV